VRNNNNKQGLVSIRGSIIFESYLLAKMKLLVPEEESSGERQNSTGAKHRSQAPELFAVLCAKHSQY
jgi:hypothetical protein